MEVWPGDELEAGGKGGGPRGAGDDDAGVLEGLPEASSTREENSGSS